MLIELSCCFQGLDVGVDAPLVAKSYEGVFYNYLSIGMDAQVAYGFHHLRNTKPYLAQGPISNKVFVSLLSSAKLLNHKKKNINRRKRFAVAAYLFRI